MMMNTHKALAQGFINGLEDDKAFIISSGHFHIVHDPLQHQDF